MKLLTFKNIDVLTRYEVDTIYYDCSNLPANLLASGVQIEEIPEPATPAKKREVALYNAITKEFYYEYLDRPLTVEEQLTEANQKIALMQTALDDLIMGGGL